MLEKKLVVIDGYGFLFRAYHSMPALSRPSDGVPVGAVYGFISMMMKVLFDMKPSHVVIVFDSGQKTFRHDIYKDYKAHRPPPPDDLIPQFALVRDAAKALNVAVLERRGYEADDIIATLSEIAKSKKEEVLIVSSDKDLMQLVNEHTHMYDAMKSKMIGIEDVKEKYGVAPSKIRDFLALVGDTSDNVPGVPGVGPKTAAELLNKFDDIEGIFANLSEIKQTKRRETLENSVDIVKLSRQLVSLDNQMDLGVDFEMLKAKKVDPKLLLDFLHKQSFRTLVLRAKKIFGIDDNEFQFGNKETFQPDHIKTIQIVEDLKQLISQAEYSGKMSIYFQPNFLTKDKIKNVSDVHSASISIGEKNFYYIPIAVKENQGSLLLDNAKNISLEGLISALRSVFEDRSITKIVWNYKAIIHLFEESGCGVNARSFEDAMLMAYDLGSGRDNIEFANMIAFFLEEQDEIVVSGLTKSCGNFEALEGRDKVGYVTKNSYFLYRAYDKLCRLLFETKAQAFYKKIDLPLTKVVARMETNGFMVNKSILVDLEKIIDERIAKLSKEIYQLAGMEFNISSSQQLSDVLFHHMGIKPQNKPKKSEFYSTGADILEKLQLDGHVVADYLIQWRKLTKIKTTYTSALVECINLSKSGERIHSNFSIALTSTGRFSSTDPNLQNIPVRGEFADSIRSAFVARRGCKIVALDYSQIELRVIAAIADVSSLKDAFKKGLDIHTVTAGEIFGVRYEEVDKILRNKAKAINFGIIYGISAYGLAKNVGITQSEAAIYIAKYFKKYPEIETYMEKSKKFAHQHGYVETIAKRRCYVNNINAKEYNLRSFGERAAINFPIQGSSSDVMRKAMVKTCDLIRKKKFDCKMILQVHDELLFEVNELEVQNVAEVIKSVMENVVTISVVLPVNISIGDSWVKI